MSHFGSSTESSRPKIAIDCQKWFFEHRSVTRRRPLSVVEMPARLNARFVTARRFVRPVRVVSAASAHGPHPRPSSSDAHTPHLGRENDVAIVETDSTRSQCHVSDTRFAGPKAGEAGSAAQRASFFFCRGSDLEPAAQRRRLEVRAVRSGTRSCKVTLTMPACEPSGGCVRERGARSRSRHRSGDGKVPRARIPRRCSPPVDSAA
jgi:hypothetical protein